MASYISKSDFMLVAQPYKDMGRSEEQFVKLSRAIDYLCAALDLADESTKVTQEETITNLVASSAVFSKCRSDQHNIQPHF